MAPIDEGSYKAEMHTGQRLRLLLTGVYPHTFPPEHILDRTLLTPSWPHLLPWQAFPSVPVTLPERVVSVTRETL